MTPRRTSLSSRLCLLLPALFCTFALYAADFTQTVSREGGQIGLTQTPAGQSWIPEPITIHDNFFGVGAPNGILHDVYVTGVLKINDRLRKVYADNWKLEITYEIKLYNASNTLVQTLAGETLAVTYFQKNTYDDYVQKIYRSGTDYHKAVVSVTQIRISLLDDAGATLSSTTPSGLGTLYDDISFEWQCTSIRRFELASNAIPAVNHVSGTQINPQPVCTDNAADNIIRLAWNYLYGAESYDVEWLFLDIPPTSVTAQGITLPSVSQSFDFDWRNASRVNITDTRYDIPLLYPTGVIVYRVRAVGVDVDNNLIRKEGTWSRQPSGGGYLDNLANIGNNDRFVFCGLETEQNWTSTLSFAEEGKRKGIVSFADGAGRTRQTVTTLSTDQNTVVLEPSLDHMGRTAVQYLPVPVRGEHFGYFSAFNGGFDANVYDTDAGYPNGSPVNGIAPTANSAVDDFYSTANPFVNLTGITTPTPYDEYLARLTSYLPDARSYPFTQTRFMNDGSGRVHSSSGVGDKHMLGGGHDMRYYYGVPLQVDLDRLFGSEAGFAAYYKKNMAVDPNGQISVTYLDGYGRTVATALAGTQTQDRLQPIFTPPVPVTADILIDNHEVDLVKVSQTVISVSTESMYDFSYTVTPGDYRNVCTGNYACKMEFMISVTNDEGIEQLTPVPVWKNVEETTFPYQVSALLIPGSYTVSKNLRIIQDELDYLRTQADAALGTDWQTTNTCFTAPEPFNCPDCSTQCVSAYKYTYNHNGTPFWIYRNLDDGGPDYTTSNILSDINLNGDFLFTYVSPGDPRIADAEAAILACQALCDNAPEANTGTECEMKRILLLRDLLPDGQYFENRPKDPVYTGLVNTAYDTGSESAPDNRNAWLETYAADLKDDFGALLNPSLPTPTWEDIRANWGSIDQNGTGFQTLKDELFTRHPEYCAWKAFCGNMETPCLCPVTADTAYYKTPRNYADVMLNTMLDFSAAEAQLFAPTGAVPVIQGHSGTYPVTAYLPSGGIYEMGCMDDPLLYCNPGMRTEMQNRLVQHMSVTVNGSPLYISVWYLMANPENLHLHDLALGSHPDYPDPFVAYMQVLHGSPANPGGGLLAPWNTAPQPNRITRWQFFRGVYEFHRTQLMYQNAVNTIQTCIDCPNPATVHPLCPDISGACAAPAPCAELPFLSAWDYDDDGYLDMGAGNNSFDFSGMQVRYPYIGLLALPPTAQDLAASYCETNCSALAHQWISQLENGIRSCVTPTGGLAAATPALVIPEADRLMLRNYFINICSRSCEDQTTTGTYTHDYTQFAGLTAADWSGPQYSLGAYQPVGSGNVIKTVNDVVARYMDYNGNAKGCPVLVNTIPVGSQPAPDLNAFGCTCTQLADFIRENGGLNTTYTNINPLKWRLFDSSPSTVFNLTALRNAFETAESATPAEQTQIQGLSSGEFRSLLINWTDACNNNAFAQIPPITLNGAPVNLPMFLVCDSDSVDSAGQLDCAGLLAEGEPAINTTAFEDFKWRQMTLFDVEYPRQCLANAQETFTVSYETQEYHYTLYYYDQAGNLVKTVPPAGVTTIDDPNTLNAIQVFRKAHYHESDYPQQAGFVWPAHSKITNYVYNGQNQVTKQTTPDGGVTLFFYDALGRLVLSQNAQQDKDGVHAYTLFDAIGRTVEVGEMPLLPSFSGDRVVTQGFVEGLINSSGYSPFITEVEGNKTTKTQITRTFYDRSYLAGWNLPPTVLNQQNLRNRIATVAYYAVYPASGWGYYDNATHYTYDEHGNVNRLAQDIPFLQNAGRRFLYTDYVYDPVSGNVNEVHYMKGFVEQLSHYYRYDADNRLMLARTSKNGGIIKELEAKYFYYPTGMLARTELGRAQVQGMDHAYTVQGWLKGINADDINTRTDIGNDARYDSKNLHALFGMDAAGFTLGYFDGDYSPLGSIVPFEADVTGSDLAASAHPNAGALPTWGLYNGNIAKMVTAQLNQAQQPMEILGRGFMYDQLNRIITASVFTRANATDHQSTPSVTSWNGVGQDNRWNTFYSYDADGNIQKLYRDGDNGVMDDLTYHYNTGSNQLTHVTEAPGIPPTAYPDDLEDQVASNYQYDRIGNLISDLAGEIADIKWTVYGKIKSVRRSSGSGKSHLWFGYSPGGQRIAKLNKVFDLADPDKGHSASLYALDAQGNIIAIYEYKNVDGDYVLSCPEQMVYGSKRIGTLHRNVQICTGCDLPYTALENSRYESVDPQDPPETVAVTLSALQAATLGTREYEFSNHLGNVLTTVADRKTHLQADVLGSGASAVIFQYRPEVITGGEYYPFGSPLPGRNPAQACSTVTTQQTVYVVNEDFSGLATGDIVLPDWEVSATSTGKDVVTDGGSNKALRIVTSVLYGGFARYFATLPGTAYTVKLKLRNTHNLNVSVRRREVGNPANYQQITGQTKNAGTGYTELTFTFSAQSGWEYYLHVQNQAGTGTTATFYADDIQVYHTADVTATLCAPVDGYRFGFNGQEKENELYGEGNGYTAEFWEYDSRLGRRWNVDPVDQVSISNYACFYNSPLRFSDKLGNKADSGDPDSQEKAKSLRSVAEKVMVEYMNKASKDKKIIGRIERRIDITGKSTKQQESRIQERVVSAEYNYDGAYNMKNLINAINLAINSDEYTFTIIASKNTNTAPLTYLKTDDDKHVYLNLFWNRETNLYERRTLATAAHEFTHFYQIARGLLQPQKDSEGNPVASESDPSVSNLLWNEPKLLGINPEPNPLDYIKREYDAYQTEYFFNPLWFELKNIQSTAPRGNTYYNHGINLQWIEGIYENNSGQKGFLYR